MADELLSAEHLREVTSKMIDAITSPAYVDAMRAVKSAPEDKRLDEALRRLTPDALRAQGVPLPPGMRISSRYFEPGLPPLEVGDMPGGQPNLLKGLNDLDPGFLDRIRKKDVRFFTNFTDFLQRSRWEEETGPVAFCGCAGGGAATVCGCAGGG